MSTTLRVSSLRHSLPVSTLLFGLFGCAGGDGVLDDGSQGGQGGAGGVSTTSGMVSTNAAATSGNPSGGAGGLGGGGMGAAGAAGGAGEFDTLRVTIDHLRFIKNGDLVGKGDNDYIIEVKRGDETMLTLSDTVKSADGETFNLATPVEFDVQHSPTASVSVGFWANDTGTGSEEDVQAATIHQLNTVSLQWSGAASNIKISDKDGELDVELQYDFEVLQ